MYGFGLRLMEGTRLSIDDAIAIDITRSDAGFDISFPRRNIAPERDARSTPAILGDHEVLVGRWYRCVAKRRPH